MWCPQPRATVATLIEPAERRRLDAAAQGRFAAAHADSLRQVLRVVRERPVNAILVSPARLSREQLGEVADLVHRFPGVPTVAVLSHYDPRSSERLLDLGASGVRQLLDLSAREGWDRLRALLDHPSTPAAAAILARLIPALGRPSRSARALFELLARLAPGVASVRALSARLGVPTSTFVSRFMRARVPSPKQYLAGMRLVHAACMLASPGLSVADVAHRLEFSSPQSLGRHLRLALGLTASEFRRRYPFTRMLDDYIARLVVPYRPAFRAFQPLGDGVRDFGQEW